MNTRKPYQSLVLILLGIVLGVAGCRKPPEYPDQPFIWQERDLEYIDVPGGYDTVRIHVEFQDGDGNLGLDENDTLSPYNDYAVMRNPDGSVATIEPGETYNIYEHEITDYDGDGDLDTIKIDKNKYYNNFWIEFVKINALGEIEDTIRLRELGNFNEGVETLNGRFEPLYRKDFSDDIYSGPLEGTITYQFPSTFLLMPEGEYRISVQVVDRDLNVSNAVLCSPSFVIKK